MAGTLVVHPEGWEDTDALEAKSDADDDRKGKAEAAMFYVAYFRSGTAMRDRPITFVFNGGPGSSSVWLHMGAFGPVRVTTADRTHTAPAPDATA